MTIDLGDAVRAFECLCALSLLIQCAEFWRLTAAQEGTGVWRWDIQRDDLKNAPRWLRSTCDHLFRPQTQRVHLGFRILLAVTLFWGSNLFSCTILFLSTIIVLIRWRGTFNGGSDFMTIVALTGLLIGHLASIWWPPALAWRAGLWYVTIHTLTSYFISGAIKLGHVHWRSGRALTVFLDTAIYGPLPASSLWHQPAITRLAAWSFILWECAAPLVLLGPVWAIGFCMIAAVFHGLVFWYFGLNRFFWAWAVSFPALIFCASDLRLAGIQ